jgi:hypothetical protein
MTQQQGYTKAPHGILRDPSLSPAAKVAWLLIAGMPDGYHPTREKWMAMLPCGDKRTWWRVTSELRQAGLITVEKQGTKRIYKAIQKGVESHPLRVQNNTEVGCETTPKERCEITPSKKNIIEEQVKNSDDARTRLREEVTQDMMVEIGCRSVGISPELYNTLSQEIFNDWEFQATPDAEWNKQHFLSVLRIKAREYNRQQHDKNKTRPNDRRRASDVPPTISEAGTGKF